MPGTNCSAPVQNEIGMLLQAVMREAQSTVGVLNGQQPVFLLRA